MEDVYQERIKLWTAALRSGEYRQATGRLKRYFPDDEGGGEGYCCLGVACDVMLKNANLTASERKHILDSLENDYLPLYTVSRWYGLGHNNSPFVWTKNGSAEVLTSLNDNGDHNFIQIADLIDDGVLGDDE